MTSGADGAFALIKRHLTECTVEMFDAYGMAVRMVDTGLSRPPAPGAGSSLDQEWVLAMIGFAGDRLKGGLVLATTRSAVESWLVATGVEDGEVGDAVGEFSNMLLGRLKGRLHGEGITILLSTPTSATVSSLRLSVPPGMWVALDFEGPQWRLTVRLDVSFELGFVCGPGDNQGEAAAEAGDAFFF